MGQPGLPGHPLCLGPIALVFGDDRNRSFFARADRPGGRIVQCRRRQPDDGGGAAVVVVETDDPGAREYPREIRQQLRLDDVVKWIPREVS